jgi:hypothetical protein
MKYSRVQVQTVRVEGYCRAVIINEKMCKGLTYKFDFLTVNPMIRGGGTKP